MDWYESQGRRLPWRVLPASRRRGEKPDPYRVWLSEIMLQQTTAAAAAPRYRRFLERFPTLQDLARAPLEAVLEEWAGLGYYARARNLHAAARQMAAEGAPRDEAGWRSLPGVGPYTAAAVAAIAFEAQAAPVDANIERVLIRWLAPAGPREAQAREARRRAPEFPPPGRAGDWAQALMDLGAEICTPRAPRCGICPAAGFCRARELGPELFPTPKQKLAKPERRGAAFCLFRGSAIWLVRRPERGLLGGMAALPSSPWGAALEAPLRHAPAAGPWRSCGSVTHIFTHFRLTLEVLRAHGETAPGAPGWWAERAEAERALPTVFRKALSLGLQLGP